MCQAAKAVNRTDKAVRHADEAVHYADKAVHYAAKVVRQADKAVRQAAKAVHHADKDDGKFLLRLADCTARGSCSLPAFVQLERADVLRAD